MIGVVFPSFFVLIEKLVTIMFLLYIAPPLSVDQIMSILGELLAGEWLKVAALLHIPLATMRAIREDNSEDEERLRAVLMYWVLKDPVASWRKLMWELWRSGFESLRIAADSIRHYAEKLLGQSVCRMLFCQRRLDTIILR